MSFVPQIERLAREPVLLIATDFDGTIAPIVSDPAMAEADRESMVALKMLAAMPHTHVAIVSGRALADLAPRTAGAEDIHLVGSHGSEFETGFTVPLPSEARETLNRLTKELNHIGSAGSGFQIEQKPAAVAFHYRNARQDEASKAVEAVLSGPGRWPGIHVRNGKMVIELSVVETDKGVALQKLRQRLGASAVLFLGDDVTDEDAFAMLAGPDLGIKVGPGDSAAAYRLDDTIEVARLLAHLAERRSTWLAGSDAVLIERHAVLSDQRTMALVTPGGRVTWLCLPRIDAPAIFAELLGGPSAGFFEVRPVDHTEPIRQDYMADSLVLRTEWPGIIVFDYLDTAGGRAYQRAGRTDLIRMVQGSGRVRITFAPRLDFGRVQTRLRVSDGGLEVDGTIDPIVFSSPGVRWQITDQGRDQTAIAEVELTSDPLVLELRYGTGNLTFNQHTEPSRCEKNVRFWSSWAATLTLPRVATELVRRSALVLRGLCYGPTGGFAAAATTSLPEHAGGVRNWDYRFCWPRDAAMSAAALVRLGTNGSAMKLLDWFLGILEQSEPPIMLRPVYTVTGGRLGPEGEIGELAGYLGSRPVRVGNAAAQQVQLDVFGPIAELLSMLADRGAAISPEHWRMLELIVDAVNNRWREPDHGIWEIRGPRKHYVHSKVNCWQTVDRALKVAGYVGKRKDEWEALRSAIADDVLANGWHAQSNAFGATYDSCDADAATLAVGLSGLLPPDDPRFVGTVEFVERHLRRGNTVLRYRYDDGLPGIEGGFHLCTSWLIESLALCGRIAEAHALFDGMCALAGPTGLLSEEYDPINRRSLGNFPQAYSHLGLINAAIRLDSMQ